MKTVVPANLYLITDIQGYTPQIGRLVSMMNYVRWTTLNEVEDLNVERANNYFKWFHVFEDELNHRGQIRWLRIRALDS